MEFIALVYNASAQLTHTNLNWNEKKLSPVFLSNFWLNNFFSTAIVFDYYCCFDVSTSTWICEQAILSIQSQYIHMWNEIQTYTYRQPLHTDSNGSVMPVWWCAILLFQHGRWLLGHAWWIWFSGAECGTIVVVVWLFLFFMVSNSTLWGVIAPV